MIYDITGGASTPMSDAPNDPRCGAVRVTLGDSLTALSLPFYTRLIVTPNLNIRTTIEGDSFGQG